MTLKDALARLKALGNERMRVQNRKHGADENQFGVRLGDIRKVATEIRTDHDLGLALWKSGNLDARLGVRARPSFSETEDKEAGCDSR